ncbi:hypothetical protein ACWGJW_23525, partial [Streptomyces nigrescens]
SSAPATPWQRRSDRPPRRCRALVGSTEWVAGHKTGIPAHERVIRIPARMVPILGEACNAAERAAAEHRDVR